LTASRDHALAASVQRTPSCFAWSNNPGPEEYVSHQ
jgi:hypothetical protein